MSSNSYGARFKARTFLAFYPHLISLTKNRPMVQGKDGVYQAQMTELLSQFKPESRIAGRFPQERIPQINSVLDSL